MHAGRRCTAGLALLGRAAQFTGPGAADPCTGAAATGCHLQGASMNPRKDVRVSSEATGETGPSRSRPHSAQQFNLRSWQLIRSKSVTTALKWFNSFLSKFITGLLAP